MLTVKLIMITESGRGPVPAQQVDDKNHVHLRWLDEHTPVNALLAPVHINCYCISLHSYVSRAEPNLTEQPKLIKL